MANTKPAAKTTAKKTTTKKTSVKAAKPAEVESVQTVTEPVKEEPVKMEPIAPAPATAPQTIFYANAGDQMMTVVHLYLSRTPVSYGNGKKKVFNKFGEKWSLSVREFEQEFAPSPVPTALIEQRLLSVGDDCPQEIRDRMGLNYKDGELLSPAVVNTIFTMPTDELCDLFEALCIEHKMLVAQLFMDDFENGGYNCDRQKLLKLNEISKKYVDGNRGMFASLLEDVTRKESQDY